MNNDINVDAYIAILINARRAILSERGNNPLAAGIAFDLTAMINALGKQAKDAKE